MMNMEATLCSAPALAQCFNCYLSLPIFPIHLHYDEVNQRVHQVTSQKKLVEHKHIGYRALHVEWLKVHCWPFFLKSQMYFKYQLYVALRDSSSPDCNSLSFAEYMHFDQALTETAGAPLIEIWISCKAHLSGVDQHWSSIPVIRANCSSIPVLSEIIARGAVEKWLLTVQEKSFQRLKLYWLPRILLYSHSTVKPPMTRLQNVSPFLNGLYYNWICGDPFGHHLQNYENGVWYNWLLMWQECDHLLSKHSVESEKLLFESWPLWSKFLAPSASNYVSINSSFSKCLLTYLQSKDFTGLLCVLEHIMNEVFSPLKRLWSKFQRELHTNLVGHQVLEQFSCLPVLTGNVSSRKRRRGNDPKFLVAADLIGCALESLGSIDAVLQFEQYLYTIRGPFSMENIYMKAWKAVTRYTKTLQADKLDSLARSIHKTFIFDQSKLCISLPEELLDDFDPGLPIARPSTAALEKLKLFAEQQLVPSINQFLSEGDQRESLLSLEDKSRFCINTISSKKISSDVQLQEDAKHLVTTLNSCKEGPVSRKLRAFSDYLSEMASSFLQRLLMSNNVRFWIEISKFKNMYMNDVSILTLHHKVEALVDCYLDTATPPWIKVSIPSELAVLIVSALEDLTRAKVSGHLERLTDLFEKAQQQVLNDMVPYWRKFCKMYHSPLDSTDSLPQVVSQSSRNTLQVSEISLPPLPRPHPNAVPLLSYSKLKGIRWRGAMNL